MSAAPMEWKQLIADVLQEAKVIPLWGSPPPFLWEQFSQELGKKLNLPGLQAKCLKISFNKKADALKGLGTNPIVTPIAIAPLEGTAFWAISKDDAQIITQAALQPPSHKEPVEPSLAQGYYQFLLLQALRAIYEIEAYPDLNIRIGEEESLQGASFMICEIALAWEKGRIYGKLLFSQALLAELRNFYRVDSSEFLRSPEAAHIPMSLRIVIGHSQLPLSEWQQASPGDFLRLDRCTLAPAKEKGYNGKARLALHETPLFDVAIKNGKVSLLDYSFYQEEPDAMKDEYLDEGEPHEGEEEFQPEEETGEIEEEEIAEEAAEEEAPLPEKATRAEPTPGSEDLRHIVATSEIPITLIVEIGRLRMNLDKLLQLQPGNVLELAEHADAGVSLFSGGKCVATGELVALGETVGVKITKIGS